MELETDKTYAHVMGLSAEVLHLYLNQANLTTSGTKKALVERMLDNVTTMLHLGSGESGVDDLQSDTQRTGWKLIGIGTRDQSLQLGFFGVSCLMACDILVK